MWLSQLSTVWVFNKLKADTQLGFCQPKVLVMNSTGQLMVNGFTFSTSATGTQDISSAIWDNALRYVNMDTKSLIQSMKLWHNHADLPINSSLPGQNGKDFADNNFRCIFMNKKFCILIKIWIQFAPKGTIDTYPALVRIMAWCRPGDKPLSEPMATSDYLNQWWLILLTHICTTRPQWVKP